MPDKNVTVRLIGIDDLTPKIKQASDALKGLEQEAHRTQEGGLKGMMGEFMAGVSYNIGLWNVGMIASQWAIDKAIEGYKMYADAASEARQASNRLGTSLQQGVGVWEELQEAANDTGQTYEQTAERMSKLMAVGFAQPEAAKVTRAIQQNLHDTGVDMTGMVEKAKTFHLSASEALQTLRQMPGVPIAKQLIPQFEPMERREQMAPLTQMLMQEENRQSELAFEVKKKWRLREVEQQHVNIQRAEEAQELATNREMEHRHRNESLEMEERFRDINRAAEVQNMATNREMEHRHLAINREMEDRHRMAEQAEQDADRLHSRQMGVAGGIKGVQEAATQAFIQGGPIRGVSRDLIDAAEMMRAEMSAGAAQLEEDMGIGERAAKQLIASGQMSPGVLLQEAQAAREEARTASSRGREAESRRQSRSQQDEEISYRERKEDEAFKRRIAQEDELHRRTINMQNEEIATRESMEDRRRAITYAMQDEERKLRQATEDAQFNLQYDNQKKLRDFQQETILENFKVSMAVIDALSDYMRSKGLGGLAGARGGEMPAAGEKPQAAQRPQDQAKGDGDATESTLQKVKETLEKVFTGSGG